MGIPNYNVDFENNHEFVNVGSITATQELLAVDARDSDSVDALAATTTVVYRPPRGTPAFEVRFRNDGSDNDDTVVHVYAARGEDDYTLVGTLTLKRGLQVAVSGGYYVDSITETLDRWNNGIAVVLDTPNGVGRAYINTWGYSRFVFIASTLDSTTCYIDIAKRDHKN